MTRMRTIAVAALVVAAASYAFARPAPSSPNPLAAEARVSSSAIAEPVGRAERAEVERLIRAFEARIRDHTDPIDYKFLGRLYLDRARSTGDIASYTSAEAALTKAVELSPDAEALLLLGSVRYASHDFAGALDLARRVFDRDHSELAALLLAGDAELELGRYTEAQEAYAVLSKKLPGTGAVEARLARLAFLVGDVDATDLAKRAGDDAEKQGAFGPGLAWYAHLRAQIAFDSGDYPAAVAQEHAALEIAPEYHVAHAGLARALAAVGDVTGAITEYERAIAAVPLPEYLAALGDLRALQGDLAGSEQAYATIGVIAKLSSLERRLYDRQLALFYVDHDRDLTAALEIARAAELSRPDIYSEDTLAWALYKNGQLGEARAASDQARKLGTPDARLLYHAGLISLALGDRDRGRNELWAALARSPMFDPIQADRARAALEASR
ncbi:MAG: tetratricopeptide repeat protein [Chloroflexi bacterium]|nr:MAG: tetratricopeptide repeat protein [Chloroflexota bacterium]